jgi:glycosyltransferase involved in cell wall biosynthesis
MEGFVADVRGAYRRAAVVVAPLLASAGTNIKIMEAMAMGKAIVSTPAGINGLTLDEGREVLVARTAAEMGAAILELLEVPARRVELERAARAGAAARYDWRAIGAWQARLYRSLIAAARE